MSNRDRISTSKSGIITRRSAMKGVAGVVGLGAASKLLPSAIGYAQAQSSEPIRIGFQVHRTGIGAAYGRWYEQTTNAAVKLINEGGGIGGRPVEIIAEDDGTDPKRGAELVALINEKTGVIRIETTGIKPRPTADLNIRGHHTAAQLFSTVCGVGYFRIVR